MVSGVRSPVSTGTVVDVPSITAGLLVHAVAAASLYCTWVREMACPPGLAGASQRTPSLWSPGVSVSSRTGPGVAMGVGVGTRGVPLTEAWLKPAFADYGRQPDCWLQGVTRRW